MDIKKFKNLTNYIKQKKFENLSVLMKDVKRAAIDERDTLDFGIIRYEIVQPGWYDSYRISLCTFENQIVSFRIVVYWDGLDLLQYVSKKDTSLISLIDNYWVKREIFTHEDYLTFEFENPVLTAKHKKLVENELGKIKNVTTDSITQKMYQFMTNPLNKYRYNFSGFNSNLITYEDDSTWIRLDNIDIIKNVLKSYNHVGRVYAVEKLLNLSKNNHYTLTDEDRILIKKTSQLNLKINWYYGGCLEYSGAVKKLFKEKHFLELMKINGFD
jgi:hypothetical protein